MTVTAVHDLARDVDRQLVLDWLAHNASRPMREWATDVATVQGEIDPGQLLAALIVASPRHLRDGLAAASTLQRDEINRLHGWVSTGAQHAIGRTRMTGCTNAAAGYARSGSGLVLVDPRLSELPLLDLAADVASHEPTGTLVATVADLGAGMAGVFTRSATGAVIVLSPLAFENGQPERTWAHELGHGVDEGLDRHPWAQREAFADHFARLALKELPDSLASAAPLIDAALAARRAARVSDPGTLLFDEIEAGLWLVLGDLHVPDVAAANR